MDEALSRKLSILADAAKYDASCASSGAPKRKAEKDGLGSTTGAGICQRAEASGPVKSIVDVSMAMPAAKMTSAARRG